MKLYSAERTSSHANADNPVFQRHMIAYNEAAALINGDVLEIGCGEGYAIPIMAPKCKSYLAIDKFQTELENLPANAEFRQMSVPILEGIESNKFDWVISFQVIEHIEDDIKYLEEIYRVLKPSGKFIFTTPNKLMSLTRNPWHVREYTPIEMENIVSKVFSKFNLQGIYGNNLVMEYYAANKLSVKKFTKFDVFNLQYKLPRRLLQIPYDIANRLNRNSLNKDANAIVTKIQASNYFVDNVSESCLDYFCICEK